MVMPDKTFVSQEEYVDTVLVAYISLPDTPNRARRDDRYLAIKLYRQAIELLQVKAAMLLATARRYFREPDADPLEPIRSLRYFVPVIEEIQRNEEIQRSGVMELYVDYLEQKLSPVLVMKFSNKPATPWGASPGELHPTK
jgi:hypothetical protein